ncbi:MAG: penicillin-binding transpeptidase domain-containing protein [Erysipelotrichaceae bacterium]|nr:penicillin-binding transpeptidase domain-containing protein [Erysipelotrichaceae bacterium]
MNKKGKQSNRMLLVFTILIIIIGAMLVTNVFFVTVFGFHIRSGTNINRYTGVAVEEKTIFARRGYIFDRNGNVIAQDSVSYNMYVVLDNSRPSYPDCPAYMPKDRIKEYATKLSEVLGADYDYVYEKLDQDIYQTELGYYSRNLSEEKKEQIEALGLYGIEFDKINSRNYPLGVFASHLIGYTRYNEEDEIVVGEMGFESILNDYLLGKNGYSKFSQDAYGYELLGTQVEYVPAVNGNNVYLTLDRSCQEALEIVINETTKQFGARKMWGSVMEAETGKILAWSCYPSFDPNKMNISNYLDYGSQYAYEPGSTMKTFTYAAAIDTGHYNGNKKFNSATYYIGMDEIGKIKLSSTQTRYGTIVNSNKKSYGEVTYNQAYYRSMNTGIATLIEKEISPSILEEYLDRFGFFKKVNTDGMIESTGKKNMNSFVDQIATGYGQGSSVTELQLLQAYSAVFNDGKMVKPYFIDYIQNPYTNEIIYQGKTEIVGQPIKESTSKELLQMMRQVIKDPDYGTAGRYDISEVKVVAKTGTAEILGENDNYCIASIMLGMPMDDPKVMIYLAYEARYSNQIHWATDPIKRFTRKIVKNLNLSDSEDVKDTETETEEVNQALTYEYEMPYLVNHSLSYAKDKLKDYGVNTYVLGNGDSVIRQYPEGKDTVTRNQKVFLLTSTNKIKMPNMIGWSRKELYAFWELTGIAVTMDGYGYVTKQSIDPGQVLELTDTITVELSTS